MSARRATLARPCVPRGSASGRRAPCAARRASAVVIGAGATGPAALRLRCVSASACPSGPWCRLASASLVRGRPRRRRPIVGVAGCPSCGPAASRLPDYLRVGAPVCTCGSGPGLPHAGADRPRLLRRQPDGGARPPRRSPRLAPRPPRRRTDPRPAVRRRPRLRRRAGRPARRACSTLRVQRPADRRRWPPSGCSTRPRPGPPTSSARRPAGWRCSAVRRPCRPRWPRTAGESAS